MGWLNYVPPAIADERTPNMYLCTFGGHKLYFSLCVLDRLTGFLPFQHLDSLLSNNHNNIYIYIYVNVTLYAYKHVHAPNS